MIVGRLCYSVDSFRHAAPLSVKVAHLQFPSRVRVARRASRVLGSSTLARLLVLTFSTRLGLLWLVRGYRPISDADQYLQIARNLRDGHGFSLIYPQFYLHATAFRPPIYPALIAAVSFLTGGDMLLAAHLLGISIALAITALTYTVVRRAAGERAALIAGLGFALLPSVAINDVIPLAESTGILLALAVCASLQRKAFVWAGVLAGLGVLTRPSFQISLVMLIVGVLLWTKSARRTLTFAGCALLVMLPWSIRNHVQVGTYQLTTSNGFNAAAIYSPAALANNNFIDPVFDHSFDGLEHRLLQFDEGKWSAHLQAVGLDNLRAHPSAVAQVVFRNSFDWLELFPTDMDSPEQLDGRNIVLRRIGIPLYWMLTILAPVAMWRGRRRRFTQFWTLIYCSQLAASLPLIAAPRLRSLADFALVMIPAVEIASLMNERSQRVSAGRQSLLQSQAHDAHYPRASSQSSGHRP